MSKNLSVTDLVEKILTSQNISSQEELVDELAKHGQDVTQSTISRALKRLGAFRSYDSQRDASFYTLPSEEDLPTAKSSLSDLVVDLTYNETLIVVNTKPGAASLIARQIDFNVDSVIGTVAGDDCFFCVPKSIKKMSVSVNDIKKELNL
jgi:transcriptional regulator of arginine metabolism